MPYSQDTRIGKLIVEGNDKRLVLVRFSGTEAISEPFVFHVDALSETEDNIKFDSLIGTPVTVEIKTTNDDKRYFVGVLTETARTEDTQSGYMYHLVLRPKLYLMSKQISSRVFKDKLVTDIISDVCGAYGIEVKKDTTGDYPVLEYCVQYRESDFDFVCRLMEAHGITYHHEFTSGKHDLHIADRHRDDMPGALGKHRRYAFGEQQLRDEEMLFEWSSERSFTTGQVMTKDYDYRAPGSSLEAMEEGDAKYSPAKLEDYVPLYHQHLHEKVSDSYGKTFAKARLRSHRSADDHFTASGDAPGLTPGFVMALTEHPTGEDNRDYVVVRASHSVTIQGYRSGETAAGEYSGSYVFYPYDGDKPYVPPMTTPKPHVGGIETAVVVGAGDIDVDEFGRIFVQFHWNKTSATFKSIRVRVAHMWAGASWGTQYIPRVGMEVLVLFTEGDPDRPLVIGSVYNNNNKHPYPLPGQKYVSGIKSKSPGGYNELAFDDSDGKELLRMHAQKDMDTKVLHDMTTKVDNDYTLTVKNNILIEALEGSITLKIGKTTIVMDKMSAKIDSPEIKGTATMNLETSSGATAKHTAGAAMTIQGGIVKIN